MASKLSSSKAKEILRDGTANGKQLTSKQKRYFGYIAGGGTPKAQDGTSITPLSNNPTSQGIFQFNGPSHDNGGIPISYAGQPVEVEGDETGFVDQAGDLNVFGNMYVPGTKMKFKKLSKEIAKKEQSAGRSLDKGMKLVNKSDPYNKFERLTFNSGMLMAKGAAQKQEDLTTAKEGLALLQQHMLEMDLDKFNSSKAQDGKKLKKDPPSRGMWWNNPTGNLSPTDMREINLPTFNIKPGFDNKVDPTIDPGFSMPSRGNNDPGFDMSPNQLRRLTGRNTLASRHNNPGNIMYYPGSSYQQKLGAVKGDPRYDDNGKLIGYFAKFPSIEAGKEAMRKQLFDSPNYKNLTVDQAAKRWVYGNQNAKQPGYSSIPDNLRNKKISDLSPDEQKQTLDTFTVGEDNKKYNWDGPDPVNLSMDSFRGKPGGFNVGAGINPEPINTNITPPTYPSDLHTIRGRVNYDIPNPSIGIRDNVPSSIPQAPATPPKKNTNQHGVEGFPLSQIVPEIAALFDEPDFVPGQRYDPQLYQPYQVSFQDRLNENNASFKGMTSQIGNNPAALSVLAGQKYQADSSVLADEFRTNQGITNDITNKNIALLNDAQLRNLQLADTQFVRQTQAKANTRQNVFNAANSISDKIQKFNLQNKQYNAVSSMFPQYTFDRYGNLVYVPNTEQQFTAGVSSPGGADSFYQRSREEYGPSGQLRKTVVNTPSDAEKAKLDYQRWNNTLKQKATLSNYLQSNPLGR